MEVCRDVAEVVAAVERIIDRERNERPEEGASFFFRGEVRNYARTGSRDLNPAFSCLLDRDLKWIENERRLYEEALRLNVASFHEDRTMVERVARMQHYQLPTRFADSRTMRFWRRISPPEAVRPPVRGRRTGTTVSFASSRFRRTR